MGRRRLIFELIQLVVATAVIILMLGWHRSVKPFIDRLVRRRASVHANNLRRAESLRLLVEVEMVLNQYVVSSAALVQLIVLVVGVLI